MGRMESLSGSRRVRFAVHVLSFLLLFLGGLAAARLSFELFFPRFLGLGRPFPAIAIALFIAIISLTLWSRFTCFPLHPLTLSPLLLNLLYLFDPTVDLVRSRLIFAASLWVTAVLLTQTNSKRQAANGKRRDSLLLLAALLPVYWLTMPHTVGRADTFEFQVVAPQLGIAHPTGYPLYLLLGKLFTLVPVGPAAWRLNVATAVYALAAITLLYLFGRRLLGQPLPALLGAVALGLTPTFWSQAIEAEVYSLHALIITAALYMMLKIDDLRLKIDHSPISSHQSPIITLSLLLFLIGLGFTNHLTTIFLLPPTILIVLLTHRHNLKSLIFNHHSLFKLAAAFLSPLLLYTYLPIRWRVVNGEAMGFGRFVDWVIGGRFQGAWQWRAWLDDPTRYKVVGRLFLDNWGWINLSIALIGLVYLFAKRWRMGLILLVAWLGYVFYNLNYYVPDLAVFLIPAQMVTAVWWMGGVTAVLKINDWRLKINDWKPNANHQSLIINLLLLPTLLLAVANWPQINRSQDDGLTAWGNGVLSMPLAENAAILADSEKIAPLYYLQQAEGIRPDLDIMVLPDETAYRAELDGRIAAGQTVYLARFLPGLESIYHLRSVGPLTEVSTQPMTELPPSAIPVELDFGSAQLIGYELEINATIDAASTAVTLYWRTNNQQPVTNNQYLYIRWAEKSVIDSQHPANNYYPILAWDNGEIVSDYHLLPRPILNAPQDFDLEAAWGLPFTSPDELNWQTVTAVTLPPTASLPEAQPYRAQIGDFSLTAAQFPIHIRPQQNLPVTLEGYGSPLISVRLSQQRPESSLFLGGRWFTRFKQHYIVSKEIETDVGNGRYYLIVSPRADISNCGWFSSSVNGCLLGEVEISGVPLPEGATNYEDKIALLSLDLLQTSLQPCGQLPLTLTWQSLAPISQDYTVFIQILDANDQIIGQVDAWPRQGTLPTSQWTPGQTIQDPYLIQLNDDLPPGQYRLQVGWYLLATLRRLPVLNQDGAPIDDKLLVSGLVVP